MKKSVLIAKIVFWLAFLIFMVAMTTREIMSSRAVVQITKEAADQTQQNIVQSPVFAVIEAKWELTWILWVSGLAMFLAFTVLENSSVPCSKIEPGRLYTLEKIISHNYKDHTAVLSYGNDVEIFRCRFLSPFETLTIGNEYTIQRIDGDLIFTLK